MIWHDEGTERSLWWSIDTRDILLHNEILIQRSFSAFIMPNHLLVSFLIFPYFSLYFLIFHFRSIVTKFVVLCVCEKSHFYDKSEALLYFYHKSRKHGFWYWKWNNKQKTILHSQRTTKLPLKSQLFTDEPILLPCTNNEGDQAELYRVDRK